MRDPKFCQTYVTKICSNQERNKEIFELLCCSCHEQTESHYIVVYTEEKEEHW